MNKNKKININIKNSNRKELEDKIKNSQHIMCKENHPLSTYIPKRNTSPHTMQISNSKPRLQSNTSNKNITMNKNETSNSSIHNVQVLHILDRYYTFYKKHKIFNICC